MITNYRRNRNDSIRTKKVKSPSLDQHICNTVRSLLFLFLILFKVVQQFSPPPRTSGLCFFLNLLQRVGTERAFRMCGLIYLFFPLFCLACGPPRGGVIGRPVFNPPYGNFFLSAGCKNKSKQQNSVSHHLTCSTCIKLVTLRIWKEHMSVSSTDIIAPALSNSPQ